MNIRERSLPTAYTLPECFLEFRSKFPDLLFHQGPRVSQKINQILDITLFLQSSPSKYTFETEIAATQIGYSKLLGNLLSGQNFCEGEPCNFLYHFTVAREWNILKQSSIVRGNSGTSFM